MATFEAPDLNTSVSRLSQINSNFTLIENAMNRLQNLIPALAVQRFAANLSWTDTCTRSEGTIGVDSFIPSFNTDDEFVISHPTNTFDNKSYAIIDDVLHRTDTAFSKALSDICTTDGDYVVNFGARSLGAPAMEMHLEVEDTDQLQDLTIYQFDVNRNVDVFTVTNFRRVATVFMDRDSFIKAFAPDTPLTFTYQGTFPENGRSLPVGIIVPWDCEVQDCWMRLDKSPLNWTDAVGVEIQLSTVEGTDYDNILSSSATWAPTDADGTVKSVSMLSPTKQLAAGTFIYPNIVTTEVFNTDNPPRAGDLTITLMVKRIYDTIY